MVAKTPPAKFFKKAICYSVSGISDIRKWRSHCGQWAISEIKNPYEATRFIVIKIERNKSELIARRNRTLQAAVKAWDSLRRKD